MSHSQVDSSVSQPKISGQQSDGSLRSHPYILRQQSKKANSLQSVNASSSARVDSELHPMLGDHSRARLKRKFIETFEDDEEGYLLYRNSMIVAPPRKQRITAQTMMKTIRHSLSKMSLEHGASSPHPHPPHPRKRSLREFQLHDLSEAECKDAIQGSPPKRRRVNVCHTVDPKESLSDLIPAVIHSTEWVGDAKNALITTLSRSDSLLQRIRLDKQSGALVPYKKQLVEQSWRDLIQTYYKYDRHCNVRQFTKIDLGSGDDAKQPPQQREQEQEQAKEQQALPLETEIEMKAEIDMELEQGHRRLRTRMEDDGDVPMALVSNPRQPNKVKKRAIRLHPSCTGFTSNGLHNAEEIKKIANRCYVSTVTKPFHTHNKKTVNKANAEEMDCD